MLYRLNDITIFLASMTLFFMKMNVSLQNNVKGFVLKACKSYFKFY